MKEEWRKWLGFLELGGWGGANPREEKGEGQRVKPMREAGHAGVEVAQQPQ